MQELMCACIMHIHVCTYSCRYVTYVSKNIRTYSWSCILVFMQELMSACLYACKNVYSLCMYVCMYCIVLYSSIYIAPHNSRGPTEALLVRLAPRKYQF